MTTKLANTYRIGIFMSGPIEAAKQILRKECLRRGLCVTIEPTTFIYTGGEETGFVVGLLNYPRFPTTSDKLLKRAKHIAKLLLEGTYQHSALIVATNKSIWITKRTNK